MNVDENICSAICISDAALIPQHIQRLISALFPKTNGPLWGMIPAQFPSKINAYCRGCMQKVWVIINGLVGWMLKMHPFHLWRAKLPTDGAASSNHPKHPSTSLKGNWSTLSWPLGLSEILHWYCIHTFLDQMSAGQVSKSPKILFLMKYSASASWGWGNIWNWSNNNQHFFLFVKEAVCSPMSHKNRKSIEGELLCHCIGLSGNSKSCIDQ